MADCSISLTHYGEMLSAAIQSSYVPQSLAAYYSRPAAKPLLLRHDVDVSLEAAIQLAELEASKGITSTFFLRVHAPYNLFDKSNHRRLLWLQDHGFDIGLHHEVGLYALNGTSPSDQLGRELAVLRAVLGRDVLSVSAHLPKRSLHQLSAADLASHGLLYEAGDPLFNRGLFVSDSNRRLKPSCLCDLLGQSDMLYATFHPVWWVHQNPDVGAITAALLAGD